MSFNPFEQKASRIDKVFSDWKGLYPKPYDKNEVDPYTKCRIILMNGTEFEDVWFSHQYHRHEINNDIRRELAMIRASEQQQQKRIACLKPLDENILETTISYEQLAVDLTAALAQTDPDKYVKLALDFALLEDFDHLYRYANLLEAEQGVKAERLVGCYTEIMPARPTIAHHRFPMDNVEFPISNKSADLKTKLHTAIITAAEQQTMNYYMNICGIYPTDIGRKLYQEIGMIEEEHVTHYGSLMDPTEGWAECNLMHQYTECYLYWSAYNTETDNNVKKVWQMHLEQELTHLQKAVELLNKYANKDYLEVIPEPAFPEELVLKENKEYIRKILKQTVNLTSNREDYDKVTDLSDNADFFRYQRMVNRNVGEIPSHKVIENEILLKGSDYRYEDSANPVRELRDNTKDTVNVALKV